MTFALDRADAQTRIRELLYGKTEAPSAEVAEEVMAGLESSGWVLVRAPEEPLRRIIVTLMPDGSGIETQEVHRVSGVST